MATGGARSLGTLSVGFLADAQDFLQTIEKIRKGLEGLGRVANSVNAQVGKALQAPQQGNLGQLTTAINQLRTALVRVGTAGQQAGQGVQRGAAAGSAGVQQLRRNVGNLQHQVVALGGPGGFLQQLTTGWVQGIQRIILFQTRWYAARTLIFGTTAAIRGAVTAVIDFQDEMAKVSAITEATGGRLRALGEAARAAAIRSGLSLTETAGALQLLGQAGLDAAESQGALQAALSISIGGVASMASSVTLLTTTLKAYRLSSSESARVADLLVGTVNKSRTSIEDLSVSFNTSAQAAAAANVDLSTLLATTGALANAGLAASTRGTAIRQVLASLLAPANEARELFHQLGLSLDDLNPRTNDLVDIFRRLRDSGLTVAQAMGSFELRTGSAIIAVTRNVEQIAALREEINSGRFAIEAMERRLDSFKQQFNILGQTLVDTVIQLGSAFGGVLASMVGFEGGATEFIKTLQGLVAVIRANVGLIVSLVAAVGSAGLAMLAWHKILVPLGTILFDTGLAINGVKVAIGGLSGVAVRGLLALAPLGAFFTSTLLPIVVLTAAIQTLFSRWLRAREISRLFTEALEEQAERIAEVTTEGALLIARYKDQLAAVEAAKKGTEEHTVALSQLSATVTGLLRQFPELSEEIKRAGELTPAALVAAIEQFGQRTTGQLEERAGAVLAAIQQVKRELADAQFAVGARAGFVPEGATEEIDALTGRLTTLQAEYDALVATLNQLAGRGSLFPGAQPAIADLQQLQEQMEETGRVATTDLAGALKAAETRNQLLAQSTQILARSIVGIEGIGDAFGVTEEQMAAFSEALSTALARGPLTFETILDRLGSSIPTLALSLDDVRKVATDPALKAFVDLLVELVNTLSEASVKAQEAADRAGEVAGEVFTKRRAAQLGVFEATAEAEADRLKTAGQLYDAEVLRTNILREALEVELESAENQDEIVRLRKLEAFEIKRAAAEAAAKVQEEERRRDAQVDLSKARSEAAAQDLEVAGHLFAAEQARTAILQEALHIQLQSAENQDAAVQAAKLEAFEIERTRVEQEALRKEVERRAEARITETKAQADADATRLERQGRFVEAEDRRTAILREALLLELRSAENQDPAIQAARLRAFEIERAVAAEAALAREAERSTEIIRASVDAREAELDLEESINAAHRQAIKDLFEEGQIRTGRAAIEAELQRDILQEQIRGAEARIGFERERLQVANEALAQADLLTDSELRAFEAQALGHARNITLTEEQLALDRLRLEHIREAGDVILDLGGTIQDALSGAFEAIVLGTRKLSDVFKGVGQSLLGSITKAISQSITEKLKMDQVFRLNFLALGDEIFGILTNSIGGALKVAGESSGLQSVAGAGGVVQQQGTGLLTKLLTGAVQRFFPSLFGGGGAATSAAGLGPVSVAGGTTSLGTGFGALGLPAGAGVTLAPEGLAGAAGSGAAGGSALGAIAGPVALIASIYSLVKTFEAFSDTFKSAKDVTFGQSGPTNRLRAATSGLLAGGLVAGAVGGAAAGSVIPVLGTAVGAVVGAAIGAAIAQAIGDAIVGAVGEGVNKAVTQGLTQGELNEAVTSDPKLRALKGFTSFGASELPEDVQKFIPGLSLMDKLLESFIPDIEEIFDDMFEDFVEAASGFKRLNQKLEGFFGEDLNQGQLRNLRDLFFPGTKLKTFKLGGAAIDIERKRGGGGFDITSLFNPVTYVEAALDLAKDTFSAAKKVFEKSVDVARRGFKKALDAGTDPLGVVDPAAREQAQAERKADVAAAKADLADAKRFNLESRKARKGLIKEALYGPETQSALFQDLKDTTRFISALLGTGTQNWGRIARFTRILANSVAASGKDAEQVANLLDRLIRGGAGGSFSRAVQLTTQFFESEAKNFDRILSRTSKAFTGSLLFEGADTGAILRDIQDREDALLGDRRRKGVKPSRQLIKKEALPELLGADTVNLGLEGFFGKISAGMQAALTEGLTAVFVKSTGLDSILAPFFKGIREKIKKGDLEGISDFLDETLVDLTGDLQDMIPVLTNIFEFVDKIAKQIHDALLTPFQKFVEAAAKEQQIEEIVDQIGQGFLDILSLMRESVDRTVRLAQKIFAATGGPEGAAGEGTRPGTGRDFLKTAAGQALIFLKDLKGAFSPEQQLAALDMIESSIDAFLQASVAEITETFEPLIAFAKSAQDAAESVADQLRAMFVQATETTPADKLDAIRREITRQREILENGEPEEQLEAARKLQGLNADLLTVAEETLDRNSPQFRTVQREVFRNLRLLEDHLAGLGLGVEDLTNRMEGELKGVREQAAAFYGWLQTEQAPLMQARLQGALSETTAIRQYLEKVFGLDPKVGGLSIPQLMVKLAALSAEELKEFAQALGIIQAGGKLPPAPGAGPPAPPRPLEEVLPKPTKGEVGDIEKVFKKTPGFKPFSGINALLHSGEVFFALYDAIIGKFRTLITATKDEVVKAAFTVFHHEVSAKLYGLQKSLPAQLNYEQIAGMFAFMRDLLTNIGDETVRRNLPGNFLTRVSDDFLARLEKLTPVARLARGGVLGLIGESGPEAVIPLDRRGIEAMTKALLAAAQHSVNLRDTFAQMAVAQGGGGGTVINLHVAPGAFTADLRNADSAVVRALPEQQMRTLERSIRRGRLGAIIQRRVQR